MAKMNRGRTTKMSIRLSEKAIEKIDIARKNLNLSKAGVILFALSKILKNPPSKEAVINLENRIELTAYNFPITIKIDMASSIDELVEQYQMKKNKLIGLIVSDYFEKLEEDQQENVEAHQIFLNLNVGLKKRIDEYSKKHYLPLSGIVAKSLLNGPYKGFPKYEVDEFETLFTNVPTYIYEDMKRQAAEMGIMEHFYISLCIYEAFNGENKIFD